MTSPNDKNIKDKILINVKHFKQKYTWDCGVSCVMMVLNDASKNYFMANFDAICEEEGFERSTWSIDLAYLLQRFDVKHYYCTTTIGIHPDLSSENFYRSVLSKDQQRVINRFRLSSSKGVTVEERSVSIIGILSHLSQGNPLIVLVNANLLICDSCHQIGYGLRACIPCSPTPPYQGHYIVLVGYNYSLGKVFYRNPDFKDKVCSLSFAAFDKARKSFGTDEDVIFVYCDK